MSGQSPLLPTTENESKPRSSCCGRFLVWRGTGSNRTYWKAFCSFCLVGELSLYFHVVRNDFLLTGFGLFTLVKFLVEIWGQDTPTWVCPGGPIMFAVIFGLFMPSMGMAFGVCRADSDVNLLLGPLAPARPWLAVVFFLGGTTLAFTYEVSRFAWKARAENKGHLHTVGLAAVCIHPNYFGDLFTYSGWALAAGTTCALSIPVFMIWSFVVLVMPNSDAYLAQRYSEEWPQYAAKTGTLFPLVTNWWANQVLGWGALVLSWWLAAHCGQQCIMA